MASPQHLPLLRSMVAFVGPIGPFADPLDVETAEQAFVAALSEDDALRLIEWVAGGASLETLELAERFRQEAADRACQIAGEVGQRLASRRVRDGLVALLRDPASMRSALDGLLFLADPSVVAVLHEVAGRVEPALAKEIREIIDEIGS